MEDGNVMYNGSWKYSPEGHRVANDREFQSALAKMKNTKPKVQGCLTCEHGINVSIGRKHTFACRQTILPSLVANSMWTGKFDADGKVLKRHEHEGDDEHRDPKRVRITHKQLDLRADLELTDDAVSRRATLCDTPSSSSPSSHEIAPKLHVSSDGVEDSEMRESVTKNFRVDTDMEISALETLTNAKLEVDRALDRANKMLHRLLEEIPLESEAVTKAAELYSIPDKRVYTNVYENEADAKIISGKWALGTTRAERLRGRREGRRRLRQHDDDSISDDTILASNRSEGYTVFTADVKTRFSQRAHEGR